MYSEKYNYQLNQLIDIFYKYDTPISLYNKLMKHSEYYQWLLQPDEFDYDKFHAEWITLHDGLNYNMRFRQSKSLKNSLETYLKQNYSLIADQVRERYNKIYCD